jgi:surface antigen
VPQNVPESSVARTSKIYPNWDFWFENKPSGNPDGTSNGSVEIKTSFKFSISFLRSKVQMLAVGGKKFSGRSNVCRQF